MTVFSQIAVGSVILAICSGLHVAVLATTVRVLRAERPWLRKLSSGPKSLAMLSTGFAAVVLAHTIQVWIWAFSLLAVGALHTFESAIYFSLVTSTTVGYGDLTLGQDFRIFGAFAGVTGLLTFGLSAAILVGLFERLLPRGGL